MKMRRAFSAMLACAALGACASYSDGTAPALNGAVRLPAGAGYVALGSSFASGPGLGQIKPGTPVRCTRSAVNYPTLLAQKLGLTLTDATCGGAKTVHVLGPWNELPPQIDALDAETRLVTVTIGGNDIGYVHGLFISSCRAHGGRRPDGTPVATCPPTPVPAESDYAAAETAMRDIARRVAERAPKAKLVFVDYITVVPQTACPAANLAPADAAISREVARRLAAITARVAQESGALLLPAGTMSRDHDPCSATPWANGFPLGLDMRTTSPWHPNAAGHAAIADALAAMLTR